jgi:short-subunit dehydrogenase
MTSNGTALITGASAGLGAVYADRLAKRGYDLVLVARGEDNLRELAAKLPGNAEVLAADLTVDADLARVEARLAKDDVTFFVNNAGIGWVSPVVDAAPADLGKVIDLNVTAFTRLDQVAAKSFAARGTGTIVNVGSVVGTVLQLPGMATYAATKAYVVTFTQVLAAELADTGVRVQAVMPGAVATELWDKSGYPLTNLDAETVMTVDHAVDAALAGLDAGELITIPSLPDAAHWDAFEAARLTLAPNMSRREPAERYRLSVSGTRA